jgi:hypothetical protein
MEEIERGKEDTHYLNAFFNALLVKSFQGLYLYHCHHDH